MTLTPQCALCVHEPVVMEALSKMFVGITEFCVTRMRQGDGGVGSGKEYLTYETDV